MHVDIHMYIYVHVYIPYTYIYCIYNILCIQYIFFLFFFLLNVFLSERFYPEQKQITGIPYQCLIACEFRKDKKRASHSTYSLIWFGFDLVWFESVCVRVCVCVCTLVLACVPFVHDYSSKRCSCYLLHFRVFLIFLFLLSLKKAF